MNWKFKRTAFIWNRTCFVTLQMSSLSLLVIWMHPCWTEVLRVAGVISVFLSLSQIWWSRFSGVCRRVGGCWWCWARTVCVRRASVCWSVVCVCTFITRRAFPLSPWDDARLAPPAATSRNCATTPPPSAGTTRAPNEPTRASGSFCGSRCLCDRSGSGKDSSIALPPIQTWRLWRRVTRMRRPSRSIGVAKRGGAEWDTWAYATEVGGAASKRGVAAQSAWVFRKVVKFGAELSLLSGTHTCISL